MPDRGVLFSLMALFLVLSLLGLYSASQKQDSAVNSAVSGLNAFRKVADKEANLRKSVTSLSTNDAEREIDQRILPFTYDGEGGVVSVSSEIPVAQQRVDSYFEILNAVRVFLEDTNYAKEFDGLKTDVNTPLPESWGGADRNASFVLEPQCLRFGILDSNAMSFGFQCGDANYLDIRRHDINITLGVHDFNVMECGFNGAGTCPDSDFNSENPLPYAEFDVNADECASCAIPFDRVRGHFDPALPSWIRLSCAGVGCVSPQMEISFEGSTEISYSGQATPVSFSFELTEEITGFRFYDSNILVENQYFGARVWG